MFRQLRLQKNLEVLTYHLQQMATLERARHDFWREHRNDNVLAVNFELVSHASRGLLALRKIEELSGETTETRRYREYLVALQKLPSVPHSDVGRRSSKEIKELYSRYRDGYWPKHPLAPLPDQEPESEATHPVEAPTDQALPTPEEVIQQFGITPEIFELKYESYRIALTMSGKHSDWNLEIDELGIAKGAFGEAERIAARTDLDRAVINRIKLALTMSNSEPKPPAPPEGDERIPNISFEGHGRDSRQFLFALGGAARLLVPLILERSKGAISRSAGGDCAVDMILHGMQTNAAAPKTTFGMREAGEIMFELWWQIWQQRGDPIAILSEQYPGRD